jgi:hypothetical protein
LLAVRGRERWLALHVRVPVLVIDEESARAITGWLRLGDRAVGRESIEGRCDQCGGTGYLSHDAQRRVCARCYLEGAAAKS